MRAHFGGSSRESLRASRAMLDAAVKGATADAASQLCSELFSSAQVLAGSIALRRAITDPSRNSAAKVALVTELFGKLLDAKALEIITNIASLRWSSSADLVPVIEQLAIEAQGSAANIAGELDRVEDEFFAVSQAIASSFELRKALTTSGADEAKTALVGELLGKTNTESTVKLVSHLVNNLRGRSIEAAFDDYFFALAARRNRLIAHVEVAIALSDAQKARLETSLAAQVGQPVRVNVEVDPNVVGGVSVRFGDEIIDGTISTRLANAGRAVVGAQN
jgi:F-type H+-transporting ATPase subunit delta